MRLLYVTSGFPFPLTSGYLRHYFLIKELAQRHAITLLSIVSATFTSEHAAALAPFTERVVTFTSSHKSGSFWRKAKHRMRSITNGGQGHRSVQDMGATLQRLTQREHFDVVIFSGKDTYPALKGIRGLPIVVDMCDATSLRLRGSMRYASLLRLPLLLLDYQQVRQVESQLMRRAAHVLFASARDREALLGPAAEHASVIPNGVDVDFWKRSACERGVDTLLFTGAMHYPPNADAALYLIEDILPRVRQSVPGAQLLIVGRDPTPRLVRAGQQPGVTVTGFVDDVRPYLERATVFAAPLRFGAGIQNKLLEAMAMEVPVVASPMAADGLRTESGQHPPVLVAPDRKQFVEMVVQQLRQRASQPAPDAKARQFVQEHFVWSRSAEALERIVQSVAPRPEAAWVTVA
jgi:sugar transferase (PEP-CTERM/EpsH1 system associated)